MSRANEKFLFFVLDLCYTVNATQSHNCFV
uniref:Uncharacterized protein n=1 Tax=Siphoviridae sp. ctcj91 TaxID=2826395 RepID=A0A8S5QYC6_9CAUD|nr:MAG TPA: Protein of unknown function (DUF2838) [Siphoviridae sp. ctcj91]